MEGGAARQQAAPEPGRACLPVQGFEALHQLLQTPIGINVKVEKGHAPAAGSSGSQEAWMLCFLNSSLHGVHDAATFLFGDTERAAQALPLLGSCALAPYSLPPDLLASKAPFSLTASTTSRRLLKHARHGSDAATAPQFSLGTGGSEACVAVLERLGISQTSLWDRPRLLVELHLPDLEKAVVLLVPCDRRLLLGSSSSGDGCEPAPEPLMHMFAGKNEPPPGASKYLESEGRCHCCHTGAGVKLKTCQSCGVARYCGLYLAGEPV